MGKIINYKKAGAEGVFSQIQLDNKEKVLISIAADEIKIFKLKFFGFFPTETVWEYPNLFEFFDLLLANGIGKHPLDVLVEKVVVFKSIVQLQSDLDNFVENLRANKK
jgi:hypothetical protein